MNKINDYKSQLIELVKNFKLKLKFWKGLAQYYDIDCDKVSGDLVLLMEHIDIMNANKYIEMYGVQEIWNARLIVYQILSILKDLLKFNIYHGLLNLNNIHFDNNFNVKTTDYGYIKILEAKAKFTTEEGSRFDIFCLGIWILKILGKINLSPGSEHTIDVFLENMDVLKSWYHLVRN